MKKVLSLLVGLFLLLSPIKASALNEKVEVNIGVSGDVKAGNEIEITVDVKNVERFYAASIDYKYNTKQLEITSMTVGAVADKGSRTFFEPNGATGEILKDQGIAKYSFSFTGDYEGNKGSGNFITFKAKVLTDDALKIGADNMVIKLVERNMQDNMVAMKYTMNGFGTEPDITNGYPDDSPNGVNNATTEKDPAKKDGEKTEGTSSEEKTEGNNESEATDKKEGNDNKSDDAKADEDSSSSMAIIIACVVVLGGAGGFGYMKKKKKKDSSSNDNNGVGM